MIFFLRFVHQVSITLIATGFKRQDDSDGRPLQVHMPLSLSLWSLSQVRSEKKKKIIIEDQPSQAMLQPSKKLENGNYLKSVFQWSGLSYALLSVYVQANQQARGETTYGMNRSPSFADGGLVEIPEFLKKKGRSRYPRAWNSPLFSYITLLSLPSTTYCLR